MKIQERGTDIPKYEGESGDTIYAASTIAENTNIIGYKDFISNFVDKKHHLKQQKYQHQQQWH